MPKSFDKYQDMKYNDDIGYKDLKLRYSIKTEYNLKIHEGRQGKHIKGHNNYDGKSYLIDGVDPQELVNEYAGTGRMVRDKKGIWTNKESVMCDSDLGYYIDSKSNTKTSTRRCFIHYSKDKGTHIVPRKGV